MTFPVWQTLILLIHYLNLLSISRLISFVKHEDGSEISFPLTVGWQESEVR